MGAGENEGGRVKSAPAEGTPVRESLLQKKAAQVREVKNILPVAEHIANGLLLAKQEAVEEARESINEAKEELAGRVDSLTTTVNGTDSLAQRIKEDSVKISADSAEAKAAAEKAETEATAARTAAAEAAASVSGVGETVKTAVAAEVSGLVMPAGAKKPAPKSGKDLLQYLIETAENARDTAGKALKGGAKAVAELDEGFKDTVVHILATIGATVTKAGLEQADEDEVEAEKAGIKEALAEAGAQESDDAFKESIVIILATIGATITKAGLEQADEREVEAEKAGIKAALSGDDS